MQHAVAREIMRDAEYVEEDVHWRRHLAYFSSVHAGDGFAIVGDAAAFMDPFYSPGMDWISFTATSAANLVTRQRNGEAMEEQVARYNRDFTVSHQRWFSSLYKDKYQYIGEYDLLGLAFRLDLSLYYWGVVEPPFREGISALLAPPFSPPSGRVFAGLMSLYNKRFAAIACRRRELGLLGKMNKDHRLLIPGFTLERKDMFRLFGMLREWAVLEIREGWHTWSRLAPKPRPTPITAVPETAQP